jgi:hypothetical protein
MDGMVDPAPRTSADDASPQPTEWILAPGVWPVEGTVVGAPGGCPAHSYTLVRRDGRRFQVSEPLYRLAELLEAGHPLAVVAQKLGERLGRSLDERQVARLIREKLVPWDVVAPR